MSFMASHIIMSQHEVVWKGGGRKGGKGGGHFFQDFFGNSYLPHIVLTWHEFFLSSGSWKITLHICEVYKGTNEFTR
jgi:hypothetical protein